MAIIVPPGEQSFSEPISSVRPLILIIGLGNPLLGDDGVGWAIAQEVQNRLQDSLTDLEARSKFQVEVDQLSLGGLSLMERLADCQKAILIDSIITGNQPLGTVLTFSLQDLPGPDYGHSASAHDVSLMTALEVGGSMGVPLPDEIAVVAVESQMIFEFSEALSPAVATAVPIAASLVIQLLSNMKK